MYWVSILEELCMFIRGVHAVGDRVAVHEHPLANMTLGGRGEWGEDEPLPGTAATGSPGIDSGPLSAESARLR